MNLIYGLQKYFISGIPTVEFLMKYFDSDNAKEAELILDSPPRAHYDCRSFTLARNYLIISCALTNFTRSGNIANMQSTEFNSRKSATVNGESFVYVLVRI